MSSKSKIYGCIFSLALVCLCGSVCYGATTDAVEESQLTSQLISQYGSDYAAPFVGFSDYVDLNEGGVNIKEVDMTLPGKNGFDLNITRSYMSNNGRYRTSAGSSGALVKTTPMYYYTYTINGVSSRVLIEFDKEEDMVDEFDAIQSRITAGGNYDSIGQRYFKYSSVKTTSGNGVLMIRDKSEPAYFKYQTDVDNHTIVSDQDIQICDQWFINMPQINHNSTFANVSNSGEQTRKYCFSFRTESGETTELKYQLFKDDGNWVLDKFEGYDGWSISEDFKAALYEAAVTHSLGFEYDVEIINQKDNKTYYFYLGQLNNAF